MNERKQGSLIGWASIGLFMIGALGTVLMYLAMTTKVPLEEKGPLGQIALAWKGFFGLFPSLFLNAAFLFLGARLFIKGGTSTLYRNLAGCTALSVALSILFGSLSVGAGGWIGAHTGEVVTSRAHIALGALVGLVSVFAAVWFSWLRQSTFGRPSSAPSRGVLEPVAASKPASRPPLARPVATRLSTPQTAASDEGVTAAESEALFPFEAAEPKPIVAAPISDAREEVVEAVAPMPRSPYPEDLRRKGQIPPGAKPLEPPNAPQTAAPAAYRWTAPRTNEDAPTAEAERMSETVTRGPRPLRRVEDDDEPVVDDEASPAAAADHAHGDDETRAIETTMRAETLDVEAETPAAGIPTPSWEQPALFRPEEGDEEPVDAYGTPLTLVETLRQARRLAGLERDDAQVVEELAGDADENTLAAELPTVGLSAAELGELMESPVLDEAEDVEEEGDEDVEEDIEAVDIDAQDIELQPVRSRAIPREIDAKYESDVDEEDVVDEEEEVDEEEVDVANAEDFEADEDELEEATVVVGSESIDDEDIVLAGADDDELVTAVIASNESDLDDTDDEDFDTEDADDDILVTELVEDEVEVAMPMARASAESVLEPLTLPAVAPIARSEPIQPGLFDAPAPMQTIAAQSKPTTPLAGKPVEAATTRAEATVAKVEVTPAKVERLPTKIEAAPAKVEAAKSEPTAPAPSKPEPAPKKPDIAAKKPEAVPAKAEAAASNSEPAPAKPASPAKSRATVSPEKEVVLQPAPSTSAKPSSSVQSSSTDTSRPNLLSEIGCLFIERGRVAVSMLQRQYSMDFDAACKVLDDLQEMGLIGPYLGGQRRDILLTREQWLERVSQAGAAR